MRLGSPLWTDFSLQWATQTGSFSVLHLVSTATANDFSQTREVTSTSWPVACHCSVPRLSVWMCLCLNGTLYMSAIQWACFYPSPLHWGEPFQHSGATVRSSLALLENMRKHFCSQNIHTQIPQGKLLCTKYTFSTTHLLSDLRLEPNICTQTKTFYMRPVTARATKSLWGDVYS